MVQILNATGITWPLTIPRLMAVDGAGNQVLVNLVLPKTGAPSIVVINEPVPGEDQPVQ
jgi:hypothetical protein